jgi:hypothetical protein
MRSLAFSDFLEMILVLRHGAKFVRVLRFFGTCLSRAYDVHVASRYRTLNVPCMSLTFLNVISGN